MLTRTEFLLILGAVGIACAGLVIDLWIGADAFARAGAVIVAYGVTMAGREVFATERTIAKYEARVEKIEAKIFDADDAENASPEAFSRIAKNRSKYRNDRLETVGRLIHAEIGIVVAGTLIWGFGDLAVPGH